MNVDDNESRPLPGEDESPLPWWRRWLEAAKQPGTILAISVSVVFSTFLAPAIPIGYSYIVTARQEKEAAFNRSYDRLSRETDAFVAFATTYALAIARDGNVDNKAEQRLYENIINQKIALDDVIKRVPESDRQAFVRYEKAVMALNETLSRSRSVETLKEFWERTSDLLVARQEMTRMLDQLRG